MINIRKGTGFTLQQVDFIGALSGAVTAGQLVYKDSSGNIDVVPKLNNATRASATNLVGTASNANAVGFAATNSTDGDAIESNTIGVYALDGGAVVETDQFTGTVTASQIGYPVLQDANGGTNGNVCVVNPGTTERILGYVFDVPRTIYSGQTPVTVLPIKVNA